MTHIYILQISLFLFWAPGVKTRKYQQAKMSLEFSLGLWLADGCAVSQSEACFENSYQLT